MSCTEHRVPIAVAVLVALGSPASLAVAEEPAGDDEVSETIVVVSRTDSRAAELPLAASVKDLEPMASGAPGLSLAEELATIAGVVARDRYNFAQDLRLSIRGFGARSAFGVRGVTVILDGIPLTLADGLAQVDLVDPELLGRIEVLRGPAGALYGNAAGGVLLLETAGPGARAGEDVSLRVGGFGLRKLLARAAETTETSSLTIAASALDVGGYRDHSRTRQRMVHARGDWQLADTVSLGASAAYLDAPFAEDAGGLTRAELDANPRAAAPNNLSGRTGEAVSQSHVGASLGVDISADDRLEGRVYHGARSFTGAVPFRVIELDRNSSGATVGLRSNRTVAGRRARLTATAEASSLRDRRINFASSGGLPSGPAVLHQNERVRALAGWAQAQVWPFAPVSILAGARYDSTRFTLEDRLVDDGDDSGRRRMGAATGMLGATYQPLPALSIFANLADAFETPTVSELSQRADGLGGLERDLSPQRARSVELGARGSSWGVRGEASAFYTAVRDELIPFEDETARTFFRNAGRSHRLGAELAVSGPLPGRFDVTLTYSWLRARFADYELDGVQLSGNAVPGMAPHRLGAALRWAAPRGLFAGLDYEYQRRMFADDANLARSRSDHLVSVRAGVRGWLGRFRYQAHVGVANLTNRDHLDNLRVNAAGGRFFEPGWPRYAYAGLTIGWDRSAEH